MLALGYIMQMLTKDLSSALCSNTYVLNLSLLVATEGAKSFILNLPKTYST
jgi:hypothetical protein